MPIVDRPMAFRSFIASSPLRPNGAVPSEMQLAASVPSVCGTDAAPSGRFSHPLMHLAPRYTSLSLRGTATGSARTVRRAGVGLCLAFMFFIAETTCSPLSRASADAGKPAKVESPTVESGSSPGTRGTAASLKFTVLLSGLKEPIQIVATPKDTAESYLVAEKGGRIFLIPQGSTTLPPPLLNLSELLDEGPSSQLLGIAPAPDFLATRNILAHVLVQSKKGLVEQLLSFQADTRSAEANSESEQELLSIPRQSAEHLGSAPQFGPDGKVYVGIGDGGGPAGTDRAQNRADLFGDLLRLDFVDLKTVRPSSDNPFAKAQDGKPEIFAFGFRDPDSISFGPNSQIWVSDNGKGVYHEVNAVKAGGNFGWGMYDGKDCLGLTFDCMNKGYLPPLLALPSKTSGPIVLGPYYDGARYGALQGKILIANPTAGTLSTLDPASGQTAVIADGVGAVRSLTQTSSGRLLAVDSVKGTVLDLAD